jgi:hypothetical protein
MNESNLEKQELERRIVELEGGWGGDEWRCGSSQRSEGSLPPLPPPHLPLQEGIKREVRELSKEKLALEQRLAWQVIH